MDKNESVFAFACRVKHRQEWGETTYNARSAAEAKRLHLLKVRDAWDNVQFVDIRARKLGAPFTDDGFTRTAVYRGLPTLRCGDFVRVGNSQGVLVGYTDTACFEVLFTSGKLKDLRLSVHPLDCATS